MDAAKLCSVLKDADYSIKDLLKEPGRAEKKIRSGFFVRAGISAVFCFQYLCYEHDYRANHGMPPFGNAVVFGDGFVGSIFSDSG